MTELAGKARWFGDWYRRQWDDGTTQYVHKSIWDNDDMGTVPFVCVERYPLDPVRRQWHLVDRRSGVPGAEDDPKPPIFAGPFPTVRAAQAAFLLIKDSLKPYEPELE